MNPNLEGFKRRSASVESGGKTFVVRELPTAADVVNMRDDPDHSLRVLVACVFEADGVTPAFSVEDIPDIKKETGLHSMMKLVTAVHSVNGLNLEAEVKNSEAAASGG